MNLRLTSSSMVLTLSAKSVVGDENDVANHIAALTQSVNASYQKSAATSIQHRAVQSSQSSPNSVGTTNKLNAADVGVLGGGGIGRHRRRGNDLFGKNRHRRAAAPSNDASDQLRFLQENEVTCERPDTCEPNLCACVAAGGKAKDCATELNNVCNGVTSADGTKFTIEGCVNWPDYYNNLYCPFAKCLAEGGGRGTCSCDFYATSYELYKDDPRYTNDEDALQHFAAHACCQTKDEEDEDGKLSCIKDAPTSMPSGAPSAPTTSPTTGSPSFTASPTISPKPTSSPTTASPTKKATVASDESSATPPTPPALDSAPSSDATATASPPADGATPPTPEAPAASSNSVQSTMAWGVAGSAVQFFVAAIVWSLFA